MCASGFDFDRFSAAGATGASPWSVLLKNRNTSSARLKVDNYDRAYAADIPTALAIDNLAIEQLHVSSAVRLNLTLFYRVVAVP